jgi:hypothetical protein
MAFMGVRGRPKGRLGFQLVEDNIHNTEPSCVQEVNAFIGDSGSGAESLVAQVRPEYTGPDHRSTITTGG